jgi:hypothetical protein
MLMLVLAVSTAASPGSEVTYIGGTVASLKEGTLGAIDTTSDTSLLFIYDAGKRVSIPYVDIDSYSYSREVAHHLGVLPAIGVGLLKKRQRKHFLRITYRGENGSAEVVVFEVPKQMPRSLLAVLQTKAPQGCTKPNPQCTALN